MDLTLNLEPMNLNINIFDNCISVKLASLHPTFYFMHSFSEAYKLLQNDKGIYDAKKVKKLDCMIF